MPSRETVWFVPLLLGSLLVAMAFTIFLSPAIGVPLLLLAAIVGGVIWFRRERTDTADVDGFREQSTGGIQFDQRDRETLTPSESDPSRH
jgi:hypothetical protein